MANNRTPIPDDPEDRREVTNQGSSLSVDEEIVDQDPGERQKRNQGDEKDDPLAA